MLKELIESVGVAVLFAACGVWSSGLYADRGTESAFVGVPFALLCALLMVRRRFAVLVALLISLLWPLARLTAVAIDMILLRVPCSCQWVSLASSVVWV